MSEFSPGFRAGISTVFANFPLGSADSRGDFDIISEFALGIGLFFCWSFQALGSALGASHKKNVALKISL